jgi:multisubunit Na+/H+ antiporter MnhB subunit
VDTEIFVYRVVGLTLLVCLPVALAFIVLPARTTLRKRIRWGAVAFVGLGCLFVGLAASWPGPNTITSAMMLGGLIALAAGSFCLTRSFCRLGQ